MPGEAAANGDYLLPTVFHSVQSDESRHISNGYSIILMALADERNRQLLERDLRYAYALQGFAYAILAENYCSGIPIANADDINPKTDLLTTAQLYTRSLAYFDTAATTLGTTTADQPFRNAVGVGRGRVLVDLARYDEAAAAVTTVPTNFSFAVSYSATSVVNAIDTG